MTSTTILQIRSCSVSFNAFRGFRRYNLVEGIEQEIEIVSKSIM